jgi:hypothetical protein
MTTRENGKDEGRLDEVPVLFSLMDTIFGTIEAYAKLSQRFDT